MKKNGIVNSDISRILSYLGHGDMICISDMGLPLPDDIERVDLSTEYGVPSFIYCIKTVLSDMVVEKAILAKEIKEHNPENEGEVKKLIGDDKKLDYVSQTKFLELTKDCKAIIRSGEVTHYANIILIAGVNF